MFKGRLQKVRDRLGSERVADPTTSTDDDENVMTTPSTPSSGVNASTINTNSTEDINGGGNGSSDDYNAYSTNVGSRSKASADQPTNANPAIVSVERALAAENFQTSELCTFDACVEAADAMAANDSGRTHDNVVASGAATSRSTAGAGAGSDEDTSHGISDCSVFGESEGGSCGRNSVYSSMRVYFNYVSERCILSNLTSSLEMHAIHTRSIP